MKTIGITASIIAAFLTFNIQAAEQATNLTRTVTQSNEYMPGSPEAISVQAWLQARKSEGQVSELFDPDQGQLGLVTVEITNVTKIPLGKFDEIASAKPETISGGGTTLPTSGTPGETITITSCKPNQSTVTQVYVWTPDANGGSWVCIDTKNHIGNSVSCK